jgi:hypothetical protein
MVGETGIRVRVGAGAMGVFLLALVALLASALASAAAAAPPVHPR